MMQQIRKYPRTPHIEGSRFQPGDEELPSIPFSSIAGKYIVVAEKMDGANSAISFSPEGELRLQSRGHYLTGGPREKHFDLLKTWGHRYAAELFQLLGKRYIMYGEWLYAKHTIFYDNLPHYFMEFDILDLESNSFLSTAARREMLNNYPFITSEKILFEGQLQQLQELQALLQPSTFISTTSREKLRAHCIESSLDPERALLETDAAPEMEGLYIKRESDDIVLERYKFVRADFLTAVENAQSHWLNRPIIPNQLKDGIDLFS